MLHGASGTDLTSQLITSGLCMEKPTTVYYRETDLTKFPLGAVSLVSLPAFWTSGGVASISSYPQSSFPTVPLTTVFARPTSCATLWTYYDWRDTFASSLYHDYATGSVNTPCYPSGYIKEATMHWSPGVCPSGWTTLPNNITTAAGVTTATCCPSGFVKGRAGAWCSSNATSVSAKPIEDNAALTPNPSRLVTSAVLLERPYTVFYAQSDLSIFPVGAVSSVPSSLLKAPTGSNPGSTGGSTPNGSRKGLSAEAKVGIGVGCALAALFIMGVVLFMLWYRRKHLKTKDVSPAALETSELENKQINEMNTDSEVARQELDALDKGDVAGQVAINGTSPDAEEMRPEFDMPAQTAVARPHELGLEAERMHTELDGAVMPTAASRHELGPDGERYELSLGPETTHTELGRSSNLGPPTSLPTSHTAELGGYPASPENKEASTKPQPEPRQQQPMFSYGDYSEYAPQPQQHSTAHSPGSPPTERPVALASTSETPGPAPQPSSTNTAPNQSSPEASSTPQTAVPPASGPATTPAPAQAPLTAEEVELRWLEQEEERIRNRRNELLRK
ncbi:MAG: hypothetical protein M1813_008552 [Trichoglossum hirsutum]|nr:MAG: hypothetical protein M1813_008552 [Trichoglossum hirsutum]